MLMGVKRIKNIKPNFNFGKVCLVLPLSIIMLFQAFTLPVNAAPTIKTMTVTIGEGGVDQRDLSKTVNIPNLKTIVSVTTDTGNINYTLNGRDLILNARDGAPSRTVSNSTKYSKSATDYKTNTSDSFANTISFSDAQGYSGPLSKNGSSSVISGNPSDSKTVTEEIPLSTKSSISYDKDGYRGTLPQISKKFIDPDYWITVFSGVVTRPDTRVWRQDYRGTVYKAGTDNYYEYKVIIEYIGNQEPVLITTQPIINSYFG